MTDDPTDFIRASREICDAASSAPWEMYTVERDGYNEHYIKCANDVPLMDVEFESDAIFVAAASIEWPRALDLLEAQQEQIEALEQVASGNDERIELIAAKHSGQPYDAARLAALNEMVSIAFPSVTPSMKMTMENIELKRQLAEQQAEIERLTNDLKHIAYNISLSVPPGYGDAEGFYRAGLMSAINRAAWAVSPKDKP